MENKNNSVEYNLISDRDVPISNKIRIFTHTFRVSLKIVIGNEGSNNTFERNIQQISLNLNK